MNQKEARSSVTSTGIELLAEGLVARTWGNVSCRIDSQKMLITPSGLDYLQTKDDDLAVYDFTSGEWTGPYKPSSEKGVHASAYEVFPEVNFVIHTHQTYATAICVAGLKYLDITDDEKQQLGGIAEASYGLSGTKKLKNAVKTAFMTGAHTVLMKHHGVVIAGESKEDVFDKIRLLENICKRSVKGLTEVSVEAGKDAREKLTEELIKDYPNIDWDITEETICYSSKNKSLKAEIDDMAQMIGGYIDVCTADKEAIAKALQTKNALLIPNLGAIVNGGDKDDTEALKILVNKACVSALNTMTLGVKCTIGFIDVKLMNYVYKKKYSKQKNK